MKVVYYIDDQVIYKTKTDDLKGLITAIEKSDKLAIQQKLYSLDRFQLSYYKSEKDHWKEEFMVFLKNHDK